MDHLDEHLQSKKMSKTINMTPPPQKKKSNARSKRVSQSSFLKIMEIVPSFLLNKNNTRYFYTLRSCLDCRSLRPMLYLCLFLPVGDDFSDIQDLLDAVLSYEEQFASCNASQAGPVLSPGLGPTTAIQDDTNSPCLESTMRGSSRENDDLSENTTDSEDRCEGKTHTLLICTVYHTSILLLKSKEALISSLASSKVIEQNI